MGLAPGWQATGGQRVQGATEQSLGYGRRQGAEPGLSEGQTMCHGLQVLLGAVSITSCGMIQRGGSLDAG